MKKSVDGAGNVGLVVVAHGSTRAAWHDAVMAAFGVWKARFAGESSICFVSGQPDAFKSALSDLYETGVRRFLVFPLFVGPGGHVSDDIDEEIKAFLSDANECSVERLGTLLELPEVIEAIGTHAIERAEIK